MLPIKLQLLAHLELVDLHMLGCNSRVCKKLYRVYVSPFAFVSVIVDEYSSDAGFEGLPWQPKGADWLCVNSRFYTTLIICTSIWYWLWLGSTLHYMLGSTLHIVNWLPHHTHHTFHTLDTDRVLCHTHHTSFRCWMAFTPYYMLGSTAPLTGF